MDRNETNDLSMNNFMLLWSAGFTLLAQAEGYKPVFVCDTANIEHIEIAKNKETLLIDWYAKAILQTSRWK